MINRSPEQATPIGIGVEDVAQKGEIMNPDEFMSLTRRIDHIDLLNSSTPESGTYRLRSDIKEESFDPFEPRTWRKSEKLAENYDIYLNPKTSRSEAPIVYIRLLSKIRNDMLNRKNRPTLKRAPTKEELKRQSEMEENAAKVFYKTHPNLVDESLREVYSQLEGD